MTSRLLASLALTILFPCMAIADGDPVAGRKKANACAPCHGLDGLAKLPNAANLAGESVFYLTKQMNAFRTGDRQDENMSVVAKPLTDQDIADLAAWYSLIEVTVRVPSGG
jgi:cytochrome c553